MVWVVAIAGLLAFVVLIFYVLFRESQAGRWQHDVRSRLAMAHGLRTRLNDELKDAARAAQDEADDCHERALQLHLRSVSVSELDAYPGIGPGTIERLRAAGYQSIGDLRGVRLKVPGLGEKRVAELNHALRGVVGAAQSRFDAGACPEAHRLAAQLSELRRPHEAREAAARARLDGIERFLAALQPLVNAANKISFWSYLRDRFTSADGVDLKKWLAVPMPSLDEFLREAGKPVPVGPPPAALPVAVPVSESPRQNGFVARPADGWVATEPAPPPAPPRPAADELEQLVAFAWAVARADGRVARAEREAIEAFLRRRYGEDRTQLNRALNLCAFYETAAIDVEACLKILESHGSDDDRRALFDFAVTIADATGTRNEREAAFLERVAAALCVPLTNAPVGSATTKSPSPPATSRTEMLAILEIDSAVTPTAGLVRRQFNLLAERYAPERVAHAADLQEIARAKLTAVRTAATALLAEWNEPLEEETPAPAPAELRHNPDLDALFGAT
jgi:uncharacterized tellurite resistance protein B-like protein